MNKGDGTSTNQNQGITLNKTGQQLIGSGTDFVFDQNKFTTSNGGSPTSILITAAGDAPTIGNVNALQDGVTISANDITIAGLIVDNANTGRDGIVVRADGASAQARNITIQNVTAKNSRIGLYVHGTNGGSASARVQNSITTSNSQHGMAIYDDTDGLFEVDLGGGTLGSIGRNVLAGNTLEDLAIEYDGRTLSALNNWWGQASGADMDTPDVGIRPQIYYGAPMNEGLVGHWTFDTEWTSNTTAFDRSGNGNNGVLQGGLSLLDKVTGQNREALDFDGMDDRVDLPNVPSLDINEDESFTVFVSFNPDDVGTHRAIIQSGFSTTTGFFLRIDPSANNNVLKVKAEDGDGDNIDTSGLTPMTIGTWRNAALVWADTPGIGNNDVISLYEEGKLVSTSSATNIENTSHPPFKIGTTRNNITHFSGKIDDTRIYNRALQASELAELHRMDTSSTVNTSGFLTSAP